MRRQLVLSSNVANLDTPGFTPSDVDFESALSKAQAAGKPVATNSRHLSLNSAESDIPTSERPDKVESRDGNSVDLDMQMARLGQNAVSYQANIKAASKKLAILKYAASEGAL
jgi:flagellar basal-body rod protein FlgB